MKELIKPNHLEKEISDKTLEGYCELYCTASPPDRTCNKACTCRTYANDSILDSSDDILF